eukprot:TRINITY_DN6058_c0_g1_i1.p1 TRINITY_DN6058_c0_g1~~TRINITY_DN6058_c0_g1_i1.p1  ORF type:complete len:395 (-),score=49.01 TRINITY_DN6058_c0_g1_i1:303-1463(-)
MGWLFHVTCHSSFCFTNGDLLIRALVCIVGLAWCLAEYRHILLASRGTLPSTHFDGLRKRVFGLYTLTTLSFLAHTLIVVGMNDGSQTRGIALTFLQLVADTLAGFVDVLLITFWLTLLYEHCHKLLLSAQWAVLTLLALGVTVFALLPLMEAAWFVHSATLFVGVVILAMSLLHLSFATISLYRLRLHGSPAAVRTWLRHRVLASVICGALYGLRGTLLIDIAASSSDSNVGLALVARPWVTLLYFLLLAALPQVVLMLSMSGLLGQALMAVELERSASLNGEELRMMSFRGQERRNSHAVITVDSVFGEDHDYLLLSQDKEENDVEEDEELKRERMLGSSGKSSSITSNGMTASSEIGNLSHVHDHLDCVFLLDTDVVEEYLRL